MCPGAETRSSVGAEWTCRVFEQIHNLSDLLDCMTQREFIIFMICEHINIHANVSLQTRLQGR